MEQEKIEALILDMHGDLKVIKLAIQGNGVPGLHDRITNLEDEVEPLIKTNVLLKWFGGVITAVLILLIAAFLTNLPDKVYQPEHQLTEQQAD